MAIELVSREHRRELGDDPSLDGEVGSGLIPPPPGYPRGYTAVVNSASLALDSRRPRPAPGSGVRIEVQGSHASELRQSSSWVTYGGSAGGFLDMNDHGRVVSVSVSANFADPLGHEAIPFTGLVQLGGFGQMRGFYPGRLVDRSSTVAELAYKWPIWVWLDGSIRAEVGNVFGEHLQDFKPGLLRFSGAIGVESVSSPDNALSILFGVGSETFESGGKIDAFRVLVGTNQGSKRVLFVTSALALLGCGSGEERRFPLRDAVWLDTDLRPIPIECESRPSEKDPKHVACAPRPYVSPLAWDGIDNSIFRPFARVWAVDPPREAPNVNAFDEVPDSAWFTNRIGRKKPTMAELVRGACTPDEILDADPAAPGTFVIDHGKDNGASAGFRIKVAGKRKYMMKTDVKEQPERPSAASAIGAAIYHAVGFNTSCEQVVFADPHSFKLTPGLKVTNNSGVTRPFDEKMLEEVLAGATRRGDRVRLQASAWLPGYLIGPFRYEKTRSDDPNDAIDHDDRRDLRGARVLAAWLDHFDAREQNSMDSWSAEKQSAEPDSSPGHVRHYYLDTSDGFGSEWAWDGVSRRLGSSYLLDWETSVETSSH